MAEYIKREAALAICEEEYREQLRILNYAGDSVAWNIGHAIKELPAADVDPVVRCKDCKHFKNYGKTSLLIDGKNIKAGWCHRRARYDEEYRMPPDGFCSYGERKNGGDNDAKSM